MALVKRLLEQRASPENPSTSLANPAAWFTEAMTGGPTASGVAVTERNAMHLAAVWRAINLLANSVAQVPLITYEELEPKGRNRAKGYPLYRLLHDRPNPEMSSFVFRQTLQAHAVSWGNLYAEKELTNGGQVVALWPLLPDRTWPERVNGEKVYKTRVGDEVKVLSADRVFHVPGLGFDGLKGYSVIAHARQSLGLTMAAEQFGATFFGNGSRVAGVLQTDQKLNTEQRSQMRESWDTLHRGLSNANRTAILENGLKWQQVGIPPEDAQFLGTRKFQGVEVARWFGVPPHKIYDLERGTFSNIEHQAIEFVQDSLLPWFTAWEQEIDYSLVPERDQGRYVVRFLVDGLLRGDQKSRQESLAIQRQNGVINANEWRELENMNPQPDETGEVYLVNGNMIPADKAGQAQPPSPAPQDRSAPEGEQRGAPVVDLAAYRTQRSGAARQRHQNAQRRVLQEAAGRVVKREVDAVRRGLRKSYGARDAAAFAEFLADFYGTHGEAWVRAMVPGFLALAELTHAEVAEETESDATMSEGLLDFVGQYERRFAAEEVAASRARLQEVLRDATPDQAEAAVERCLSEWEESRAEAVALRESVNLGEAVAAFAYAAVGASPPVHTAA